MRYVDTFLTRKAQAVWPDAVVYRITSVHAVWYVLERQDVEDVQLGGKFPDARKALNVLLKAERARQQ